jgi:hypothetical protein
LELETFTKLPDSEIEDLIPTDIMVQAVDRWQRTSERPFADSHKEGQPIIPQIEKWAANNGITLAAPGWKVELAKRVKQLLVEKSGANIQQATWDQWESLFNQFDA